MNLPLSFWDISLWLAVTSIILIITLELVSPHYGKTNLLVNKTRLRHAAVAVAILFLVTVLIQTYGIITSP